MNILQTSISAGLLVVFVMIIRAVALNRLPKTMFLISWGVGLLRLLVPISISLQNSICAVIDRALGWIIPGTATQIIENILPINNTTIIIWFIGMLATFAFFMIVYVRSHKALRSSVSIRDNDVLNAWIAEHRLFRTINIMQSDRITTPVAVGIVKPRIVLPKSMNMDDTQLLRYVLAHEYYHIRRFDTLWKVILVFALCIHWFNPMVWVMFILANRDLELSCDEMVLRHFGAEAKTAYAYSLIGMAEQRSKVTPLYNAFGRNSVEERIKAIMKYKKLSIAVVALAVILVAGTITTAFTHYFI